MTALLLVIAGLAITVAAIVVAINLVWRRPDRARPLVGRCELCERIADLRLVPYRDSCRWVCPGCELPLNDPGTGP